MLCKVIVKVGRACNAVIIYFCGILLIFQASGFFWWLNLRYAKPSSQHCTTDTPGEIVLIL